MMHVQWWWYRIIYHSYSKLQLPHTTSTYHCLSALRIYKQPTRNACNPSLLGQYEQCCSYSTVAIVVVAATSKCCCRYLLFFHNVANIALLAINSAQLLMMNSSYAITSIVYLHGTHGLITTLLLHVLIWLLQAHFYTHLFLTLDLLDPPYLSTSTTTPLPKIALFTYVYAIGIYLYKHMCVIIVFLCLLFIGKMSSICRYHLISTLILHNKTPLFIVDTIDFKLVGPAEFHILGDIASSS